jgi:hypothetical protein
VTLVWTDLAVIAGSASGALTGLLFVAVSLNRDLIAALVNGVINAWSWPDRVRFLLFSQRKSTTNRPGQPFIVQPAARGLRGPVRRGEQVIDDLPDEGGPAW